jgi:predicted nucleic acid-binding protein
MSQSCLTDPALSIVADTSAVINLNASGCGAAVLQALPNRMVLTDTVIAELRMDKSTGRDDARLTRLLIDKNLATVVPLAELNEDNFATLVSGSAAETLDDGEAATIACALEINAVAVIDDRKAVALCTRKHPGLVIASTVDIFAHEAVVTALGNEKLADAVYASLQAARMRVPSRHEKWVIELIGTARAKSCLSLRGCLRVGRDETPVPL